MLLLHGWGVTKEMLRPLGKRLARSGWHVVGLDLPGFGKTPTPPAAWDSSEYVTFVRAFAKEVFDSAPFIVFGHSFGGRIAIKLAATRRKSIRGVVLCAPAGIYRPLNVRNLIRRVIRRTRWENVKPLLSKITIPSLILWGKQDKVTPVKGAYSAKNLLPRALLKTFPSIGHSLPYRRPAAIAREITSWSKTFHDHT